MTDIASYLRPLTHADLRDVLEIEELSFDNPWDEGDFIRALRRRDVRGVVMDAVDAGRGMLGGFVLYRRGMQFHEVLNLAVRPSLRLRGIGRSLIWFAASPRFTVVTVRESNLGAQKFYRSIGFQAVRIDRESFRDLGELGYVFQAVR